MNVGGDTWLTTCDSLFVGRAGLNGIFNADDIDLIKPPLQILDKFYRFKSNLDNDLLLYSNKSSDRSIAY